MIDSNIFESLILTNTIVAAFCIVLLIALLVFILVLLIPSIRRRWFGRKEKEESQIGDLSPSSLSRQPSFHNVPLGASRFNPIFEPATTTTTMTQFGTLFHPQATTATLLHPTIWTSMNPTSISMQAVPTPPTPKKMVTHSSLAPSQPSTTTSAAATSSAAAVQRSPKRR